MNKITAQSKIFTQRHGTKWNSEKLAKNITPACRTWCQWSLNAVNLNIWSYKNKTSSRFTSTFAIRYSRHVVSKYFSAKNWNRELQPCVMCKACVVILTGVAFLNFLSTWAGCHFCSSALAVIRTTIASAVQNSFESRHDAVADTAEAENLRRVHKFLIQNTEFLLFWRY